MAINDKAGCYSGGTQFLNFYDTAGGRFFTQSTGCAFFVCREIVRATDGALKGATTGWVRGGWRPDGCRVNDALGSALATYSETCLRRKTIFDVPTRSSFDVR